MKFSVDSKVRAVYGDPQARPVLEKYFPKLTRTPSFQMTFGMSLRTLSRFPQWALDGETLSALDRELREIS